MKGIFVREFAKALAISNNSFVISIKQESGRKERAVFELKEEDGINTLYIKGKGSRLRIFNRLLNLAYYRKGLLFLKEKGFKMDLCYVHVFYSALPAVLFKVLYGIPYALTEHSTSFIDNKLGFIDKLKVRLYLKMASANLPVSSNLGEKIKALGVKRAYIVIPNVYDPLIFFPGREKVNSPVINMVFVGNLVEQKGLKYLLAALKALKSRSFLLKVIGSGPLKDELTALAAESGLSSKVSFLGRKTKPEIAEIMRKSDIFVLPSVAENLPCVIIEAFACGLPVLASDVGGVSEIVSGDNGILVRPGDVLGLTAALDQFMTEYKKYDKEKIAAYALSGFSYEAVGKNLSKIFNKISDRGRR